MFPPEPVAMTTWPERRAAVTWRALISICPVVMLRSHDAPTADLHGVRKSSSSRILDLQRTFGITLLLPTAAVLMPPVRVSVPIEVANPAGVSNPNALLPFGVIADVSSSAATVGARTRVSGAAAPASKISLSNCF
jgi:hypothetical protein